MNNNTPFFLTIAQALKFDRNLVRAITIVTVFALFGAYEYSRLTRESLERENLYAQLIKTQDFDLPGARIANASRNAGLTEIVTDLENAPALSAKLIPHLMVVSGVMMICLMVLWRRQPTSGTTRQVKDPRSSPSGIFDALGLGLAQWSETGRLVACNTAFEKALGAKSHLAETTAQHASVMDALAGDGDVRVLSDNDEQRLVEVRNGDDLLRIWEERPLPNGGFVTIISDAKTQSGTIRALEQSQEQLQQMAQQLLDEKFRAESASRAKTSFLAHLSHDVRTPLNHIIGFADLIAHQTYGPVGDRRYLTYISDIKSSGEKLLASFSEILELAQLEGGHLVLRREKISMRSVVQATANRFQDSARRSGIHLDISASEDIMLNGDRICIERMIGNLVENAIQFTPHGGRVRVACWSADDGVVIEVSDTGIGMSEERMKDLSQPFVLGDAAFTRENKGVGLGIAISRTIAELSGGRLEIDSSPAVGTTVAIALPLSPSKSGRQAAA